MLEELVLGAPGHTELVSPCENVWCCELDVRPGTEPYVTEHRPGRLELFFCVSGGLSVSGRNGGASCSARQVLLLWEGRFTLTMRSGRLQGVLVCADMSCGDSLAGLFGGGRADYDAVIRLLAGHDGAMEAGQSAWSEAAFSALRELPAGERGSYCAVKASELLYLLSRRRESASDGARTRYRDPYMVDTVRRIHKHMMEHLGDRLTINELSAAFHIAPTSFKECFRELYGDSVHAYLLNRRMERASEMLRSTSIPVFRIAEAVGYGSASQFGVEFKRRYAMSPLMYRRCAREKNV